MDDKPLEALLEPSGQGARARLISLHQQPPPGEWPEAVAWSGAMEWLLA